MDAYRRGVAAILKKIYAPEIMCCGHKEYALPKGRKIDPNFDMDDFRREVAICMGEAVPKPVLIPVAQETGRPTLRRGARGDLVKKIQAALQVDADGIFGPGTEAALREFQRAKGLVPDGIAGPRTWTALDAG
jgi:murein L,D-transpeptidase YcbB/YkuD